MIIGYISRLHSVITMVVLLFTCCFCSPNVFAQNCQPPGEQIIDFNEYPPNTGACTQASLTYHTVPTSSTANVIPLDITLSGGGYTSNVYAAYNVNEGCGSRTITATFSRPVSLATIGLRSFSNGDFTFTAGNQTTTIFVPGSGEPKSVSFEGEITSMSVTAGLDQNGFYNYFLIGVGATPIPDPVPTQAGTLLVQGFGSSNITPGSDILVNGENWQHNIPGLEYKLFLDNVFESSHPVVFCNQSPSFTVSLPCAIGIGNHVAKVDLVKPNTQEVLASKQTTFSVIGFSTISSLAVPCQNDQFIESIKFEVPPNQTPGSFDGFIDTNPLSFGGGKRIFPDADSSAANSMPKREVWLTIRTTVPNTTVYVKSFDVVDTGGVFNLFNTGGDNQGPVTRQDDPLPRQGALKVNDTSPLIMLNAAQIQAVNGIASIKLVVTMQPGDNFKVVASTSESLVNSLTVSGQKILNGSTPVIETQATTGVNVIASELLTVWRRLHVEVDSMFSPPSSTANPNRNFLRGDIKGIRSSGGNKLELSLYESNTVGLNNPTNLRDLSPPNNIQDGSPDLSGNKNPLGNAEGLGNGRFESGSLVIGNGTQTVVISGIIGNGSDFVQFDQTNIRNIPFSLLKGASVLTGNIEGLDFAKREFTLSHSVGGIDYTGGTITIAGSVFQVSSSRGRSITVTTDPSLPFLLMDDDTAMTPFLSGANDPGFDLMQDTPVPTNNLFAAAYVQPVYDLTSVSTGTQFIKNYQQVAQIIARLDVDQNTKGSPDYWVVYMQGAFQGLSFSRMVDPKGNALLELGDADPASEVTPDRQLQRSAILAETPKLVDSNTGSVIRQRGTVVYVETIADQTRNTGFDCKAITIVHEVGHQFGLGHIDPENPNNTNLGVMRDNCSSTITTTFIPTHLKIIRRSNRPQEGNN